MSQIHMDETVLLDYLGGELDTTRGDEVRRHLDACETCRKRIDQAEDILQTYRSLHRELAPPPRPWPDLRLRPRPQNRLWWAAAAAGVAVAFIAIRLSTGQTVNAAELLDKASAVEIPVKRTKVKTSRGHSEQELSAMFRKASFDWQQPLRVRAFADWRKNLSQKQDEVRILQNFERRVGRYYRIKTSTAEGSLSEVSITLRAADFRAVHERFEFRNHDWVEISEAPTDELKPPPLSIAQFPLEKHTQKQVENPVTSTDELQVWAALHAIGADLGEPVEVRRTDHSIEVLALGLSSRRERQLRDALSQLANVTLKFNQPQAVRDSGAPFLPPQQAREPAPAGSLYPKLLELMGSSANIETFTNSALEQSEIALARAHALRQLSERFPDRNSLGPEDRETLRSIEADHVRELREAVRRLTSILQPLTGSIEPRIGDAGEILAAAKRIDTLLNVALASAGKSADPEKTVSEIRQSLADLERRAREQSQ